MNYSRQRELIYNALMNTQSHPTAETIYKQLRVDVPKLSLATVYRNLNQLCDLGSARRLRINGSPDRYDGVVKPHYHFCCEHCGDVCDVTISESVINSLLSSEMGHSPTYCDVIFYGSCLKCKSENC